MSLRVVTYARVSTLKQSDRGRSLEDQERAFEHAIADNGWNRVHAYAESASAKTVEGRATFQRMIADLPDSRPDLIVIHTLDRFTRNLRDGLNELHGLRGHGVKLLALDWETPRPIDMDKDEDWRIVVGAFTRAEDENRDRARRIRRSYQGRRERGATTTNRAPFGLERVGDQLSPNQDAWIVAEVDRHFLAGDPPMEILKWAQEASAGRSWTTRTALRLAMINANYVAAGLRTDVAARALAELLRSRDKRLGAYRKHEHEFTGVFACGVCVAAGIPPEQALMGEQLGDSHGVRTPMVICQSGARLERRHPSMGIRTMKFVDAWHQLVEDLTVDESAIARWEAALSHSAPRKRVRGLERQLGALDAEEAILRARAATAWDWLGTKTKALEAQARKQLVDVDRDEAALHARREALRGEIARAGADRRSAVDLREALATYQRDYAAASLRVRNMLNRALCRAIGSHPVLERLGEGRYAPVRVSWPAVRPRPIVVDYREKTKTPTARVR